MRRMRSASLTIPTIMPWSSITGMALTPPLTSSRAASSRLARALTDITPSDITSLASMAFPPKRRRFDHELPAFAILQLSAPDHRCRFDLDQQAGHGERAHCHQGRTPDRTLERLAEG